MEFFLENVVSWKMAICQSSFIKVPIRNLGQIRSSKAIKICHEKLLIWILQDNFDSNYCNYLNTKPALQIKNFNAIYP